MVKIVLPYLLSNRIKNAEKRRKREYDRYIHKKQTEEGKVTFEYNKQKKRRIIEGEYVDFEDVEKK